MPRRPNRGPVEAQRAYDTRGNVRPADERNLTDSQVEKREAYLAEQAEPEPWTEGPADDNTTQDPAPAEDPTPTEPEPTEVDGQLDLTTTEEEK